MPKSKGEGVLYYTETTVTIFFPEDRVCCEYCPLMETYARKQCRRTGEYLIDTMLPGYYCPLKIMNKYEEENK